MRTTKWIVNCSSRSITFVCQIWWMVRESGLGERMCRWSQFGSVRCPASTLESIRSFTISNHPDSLALHSLYCRITQMEDLPILPFEFLVGHLHFSDLRNFLLVSKSINVCPPLKTPDHQRPLTYLGALHRDKVPSSAKIHRNLGIWNSWWYPSLLFFTWEGDVWMDCGKSIHCVPGSTVCRGTDLRNSLMPPKCGKFGFFIMHIATPPERLCKSCLLNNPKYRLVALSKGKSWYNLTRKRDINVSNIPTIPGFPFRKTG